MEKETYWTPEITSEEVVPGLTVLCSSPPGQNALGGLALFDGSPQLEGPQLNSEYKPPQ
jgi:hypothetical protein